MPSFREAVPPIAAELLWYEFDRAEVLSTVLKNTITEGYEKIYGLDKTDPQIESVTTSLY